MRTHVDTKSLRGARTHLDLVAPGGRPSLHQPQDVEAHVVLTAPPQAEAEPGGSAVQVHAVVPRVLLGTRHIYLKHPVVYLKNLVVYLQHTVVYL